MAEKKIKGYVRSENVIWFITVSLVVGFVSGVAFGIYKSNTMANPAQSSTKVGMSAEQQGNIDMLKAQVRKRPDNKAAWIQLGNNYFNANLPGKAIMAYNKALALDPRDADVWTDLGVMYRRSGRPKKAVDCFDRAMKIDPRHQVSRFNKGVVLLHDLNDEAGALKSWESLLAINPDAKTPGGQPLRGLVDQLKKNLQEKK
jgi:cytochrome c-type biogenesis protein CcmH/NrfG